MAHRMARAGAAVDIDTGGGEVLATLMTVPPLLVATESWPPNVARARRNLRSLPAAVLATGADGELPLASARFDLVVSRHPVTTSFAEIARVLRPGGTYLSQQVGPGSVRELTDFLMGPKPPSTRRHPERVAEAASAAGLEVVDLRTATLRMEFFDIAAVVHFLRKVIWIVPGFTVERYRTRLGDLHRHIEAVGAFVAHAERFLIEARRPDEAGRERPGAKGAT